MSCESGRAFESIESAHEFVTLLAEAVAEAKGEVSADVERETPSASRRLQALQVTLYTLEKLEVHMKTTGRILNDLRSLRRLLCQERAPATLPKPKPVEAGAALAEFAVKPSSRIHRSGAQAKAAVAA